MADTEEHKYDWSSWLWTVSSKSMAAIVIGIVLAFVNNQYWKSQTKYTEGSLLSQEMLTIYKSTSSTFTEYSNLNNLLLETQEYINIYECISKTKSDTETKNVQNTHEVSKLNNCIAMATRLNEVKLEKLKVMNDIGSTLSYINVIFSSEVSLSAKEFLYALNEYEMSKQYSEIDTNHEIFKKMQVVLKTMLPEVRNKIIPHSSG